jgi:hypothetical protein
MGNNLPAKDRAVEQESPISDRRKAILARAPSRERIKALQDRLPSPDEWLDDEYDKRF